MEGRYNTRSPAVKRLMREAQELSEPTDQYYAQPLEDNLFEWHFTVRGPADSDFQTGMYHGRIILPVDYPMKPPSIIWLTPNGRFETNKKICLSISGHHPESWQPSWSIRTALLAIIGFMPTHPGGAIGSLDYKPEERKLLAKKSRDWKCPACGDISKILLEPSTESSQASQEAKELASQINFQGEKPKCKEGECPVEAAAVAANVSAATGSASTSQNVPSSPVTAINNTSTNAADRIQPQPVTTTQQFYSPFSPWGYQPGSMPGTPGSQQQMMSHPYTMFGWNPPPQPYTENGQRDIASMMPRFPYPPSHYPGRYSMPFYPPGCALPPGVGMFPCPFPPPASPHSAQNFLNQTMPTTTPMISVNNSSLETQGAQNSPVEEAHETESSVQATPTNTVSQPSNNPCQNPIKTSIHSELLSKVKRVGSGNSTTEVLKPGPQPSSTENVLEHAVKPQELDQRQKDINLKPKEKHMEETCEDGKETNLLSQQRNQATSEVLQSKALSLKVPETLEEEKCSEKVEGAEGGAPDIVDSFVDEVEGQNSVPGWTDSEVSQSLKKKESLNELTGAEMNISNVPVDGEENSEAGVPPIEMSDTEQRSFIERSSTSSMSELDKKLKQTAVKGLRQRQSAIARVPTDIDEEGQAAGGADVSRTRIEAASGDNQPQLQGRFNRLTPRALHDLRNHHRDAVVRARERHSPFDASFIIMVGLSVATVVLLLNRLLRSVDWSDYYKDFNPI